MRVVRIICCLYILLVGLVVVSPATAILAQEEEEDKIELTATYPSMEETALGSFAFEVGLDYKGSEARVFDFKITKPEGWTVYARPQYEENQRISSIRLEAKTYTEKIKLIVSPPAWPLPEPGEYPITLEVSSTVLTDTIQLKAIVTARYTLTLTPITEGVLGRYNTKATVGKDNYLSIRMYNMSTVVLDDISLSSPDKPEGWTVEFSPEKIDSVAVGDFKTIEVNIKPSAKTIAGDYYPITIRASAKDVSESIDIRVTVETPTIWGLVGVGIILLVVTGLIFTFMRFSRR